MCLHMFWVASSLSSTDNVVNKHAWVAHAHIFCIASSSNIDDSSNMHARVGLVYGLATHVSCVAASSCGTGSPINTHAQVDSHMHACVFSVCFIMGDAINTHSGISSCTHICVLCCII